MFLLPHPATADEDALLVTFASCTGRLSAELEHAWLMGDARGEDIAHRRQQFVDILSAIVPPTQRRDMLHLRIQAKIAHASLLSQSVFSDDAERATWALRRATAEVNYCAGFLLDS